MDATKRKAGSRRRSSEPGVDGPQARGYHHGSLRTALLAAAEGVLRREGLRGLTLRAISREAGVSHAATPHHFGDMAGVLSELAAQGHLRLAAAMAEHSQGIDNKIERRKAIARAYIGFAVENPDLFRLMSRNELLDQANEALSDARRLSIRALAGTVPKPTAPPRQVARIGTDQGIEMTAGWAYVHGLATLLIDGRLNGVAQMVEGLGDAAALVDATIDRMRMNLAKDGQ